MVGNQSDLPASDVVRTTANPAPPPSTSAFFWTMNLSFPNSNFTTGKTFRFNASRNQQQDATVPQGMTIPNVLYGQPNQNSADILGSGVMIPEYADAPTIKPGMTFSGLVTVGATDYPFSGRLTNRVGRGYSKLDGYGFVNAEAAVNGTLPTPGVVSRKTHGAAGTFDIALPVTGTAGLECRSPGPNNSYTLVYTFDRPVANAGNAVVTQGTAVVVANQNSSTATIGSNPNEIVVELTGVTNIQHLIVTLSGVQDTSGSAIASVPARMDVLLGDVNSDRTVTTSDIQLTQNQALQPLTVSNFRRDINADGNITTSDIQLISAQGLQQLP